MLRQSPQLPKILPLCYSLNNIKVIHTTQLIVETTIISWFSKFHKSADYSPCQTLGFSMCLCCTPVTLSFTLGVPGEQYSSH